MATKALREFCNGNTSLLGLFDVHQTTLSEHMHESENQCNNRMCTEYSEKPYCSESCRIAETTENYFRRRRGRLWKIQQKKYLKVKRIVLKLVAFHRRVTWNANVRCTANDCAWMWRLRWFVPSRGKFGRNPMGECRIWNAFLRFVRVRSNPTGFVSWIVANAERTRIRPMSHRNRRKPQGTRTVRHCPICGEATPHLWDDGYNCYVCARDINNVRNHNPDMIHYQAGDSRVPL